MSWQTANLQAAAAFLRERISAGDTSAKTKAIYDGLLEVLDPTRRSARVQREMAVASKAVAAAALLAERNRHARERRRHERRRANHGSPGGVERRAVERRAGKERRRNAR